MIHFSKNEDRNIVDEIDKLTPELTEHNQASSSQTRRRLLPPSDVLSLHSKLFGVGLFHIFFCLFISSNYYQSAENLKGLKLSVSESFFLAEMKVVR